MHIYYGWNVFRGAGDTHFATKGAQAIYREGWDDLLFVIEQKEGKVKI